MACKAEMYFINVRENRKGNHEWTIQIHWQHCAHKTQDEDKHNKQHNTTQKTNMMGKTNPTKKRGRMQMLAKGRQFLPVMRLI